MMRWNAIWFVVCLMFGFLGVARGQSPDVARPSAGNVGAHAGRVVVSGGFQFEVVFSDRAVALFVYHQDGAPAVVANVRGRMVFSFAGDRRTYRYDLYSPAQDANLTNRLYLAVDLSRVPERGVSVDVVLHGLGPQPVELTVPFRRTQSFEQVAIERQRICPVSGKRLGSMGPPPKVSIGDRDVYVCCAGCESPLKKNPRLHLAKLISPAPAKATKADANAIARQRQCPVMNEPLSAMGGPWKVTVNGEPIFVCCKACIPKVQQRPAFYLSKATTLRAPTLRR